MDRACQIQSEKCRSFGASMLLMLYNTMVTIGLFMALPVLIPLAITNAKRRHTVRQRLGWWRYPWQSNRPPKTRLSIWVHALSVGEVMAAQPLIKAIKDQHPDLRIVLTVSTLTGFQTASRIFAGMPVNLAYFPYDLIGSVRKVADMIDARAVILVETDIWPNFLAEMKRRQVPVYLVNMRLSDGAWNGFRRFPWLSGKLFKAFEKVCLQTPKDAKRLFHLGIAKERICVTGNIKFDGVGMNIEGGVPATWKIPLQQMVQQSLIVAGSTHDGEEQILLDAYVSMIKAGKAAHLIIAPRDPDRTQNILALCTNKGLDAVRLSQLSDTPTSQSVDVVVVDFIGALKMLYSMAEVAFVGGSLVNEGGHNPLEPAFFGKPLVFGPDMSDFHQIAAWLLKSGGARQVTNLVSLTAELSKILDDAQLAASIGANARRVVLQHQGAVAQTMAFIELGSLCPPNPNDVEN